jgi:glycosyltransferase involved in cell wall biosynthesis
LNKFTTPGEGELRDIHEIPSGPVVLYVGRLSKEKGVKYLIQALNRIDEPPTAVIVGEGSDRERLEQMVSLNKKDVNIKFVGRVRHNKLVEYYNMADITIVPSLYEALPFVAIEALATKTPVIASNVGGIPEVVEDGESGFLVPPKKAEAIRKKINKLLSDSSLRKKFGQRGRRTVEKKFTVDRMADKTEEMLTRLL